jgi:hypothetical protein
MAAAKSPGDGSPKLTISTVPGEVLRFDVRIAEGDAETGHRVTLSPDDAMRFAAFEPRRVVEAAFAFLLDREPNEAILAAFDIGVIRGYFPDFDRVIPDYLAQSSGPA